MIKGTPTPYNTKRSIRDKFLYTKGFEYSLDGENYIGEYHIRGDQAATGPEPSPTSKPLRKYYKNPEMYNYDKARKFKKRTRVQPDQIVFRPLEVDYENGYVYRFFVERSGPVESYPLEIDKDQAGKFGRNNGIDEGLYSIARIKWQLVGYRETFRLANGTLVESIKEHNTREVMKGMGIIPNLYVAIKNYTEGARYLFSNT